MYLCRRGEETLQSVTVNQQTRTSEDCLVLIIPQRNASTSTSPEGQWKHYFSLVSRICALQVVVDKARHLGGTYQRRWGHAAWELGPTHCNSQHLALQKALLLFCAPVRLVLQLFPFFTAASFFPPVPWPLGPLWNSSLLSDKSSSLMFISISFMVSHSLSKPLIFTPKTLNSLG